MPWTEQAQSSKQWGIRHEHSAFQVNAFQPSAFQTGEGQKAQWTGQSQASDTWTEQ